MDSRHNLYLVKFFLVSALSFFIGTTHGVLQVIPPIRHWLDSIGSPYGGPGHMIDPLAHAHINLVGGLVILGMGVTFYLLSLLNQQKIYSLRLANLAFWCTTLGVSGFYSLHVVFGIWEGFLLLSDASAEMARVHRYYGPIISVVASIMALGFYFYTINVVLTAKQIYRACRQ